MIERHNYADIVHSRGGTPHTDGQDMFALTTAQEMVDNGVSLIKPLMFNRPHAFQQVRILYGMAHMMSRTEQVWVSMEMPPADRDNDAQETSFLQGLAQLEQTGLVDTRYVDKVVLAAMAMATLREISELVGQKHTNRALANDCSPH